MKHLYRTMLTSQLRSQFSGYKKFLKSIFENNEFGNTFAIQSGFSR